MVALLPIAQFNNFQIFDLLPVYYETYQSPYLMKPAFTGCSRVDIQTIQTSVESNFQDMRMSGNKKIGPGVVQLFPDERVIMAGIASYMRHHHVYFFDFEMGDLRILQPE